ncbi:MAG TPA: hypothetical protein VFN11_14350 [Ktedonobacterales bacterium]|nr:hypothetical protein [Ktedonobacterales bacterium]
MTNEPTPHGSPSPRGITIRGRHFGLPWILPVVAAVVAVLICGCCGSLGLVGVLSNPKAAATQTVTQATTQPAATQAPKATATAQPTAKPTRAPTWTVTHTYKGNGISKTAPFTVTADQWRITWSCNPAAYGSSYNLIADLTVPGDSFGDSVVNVICSTSDASSRSGTTNEYTSGTFYLDVNSESSWVFQIEELQ